jgi:thymidylate kinase
MKPPSLSTVSSGIAAPENPNGPTPTNSDAQPVLLLVLKLCQFLEAENIAYCHWKSNNALDRSANGENDLDLLISRADITRFKEILSRLGFKRANGRAEKNIVGILDYYGYDAVTNKIVHVHAHYQLVVGHDMTKNLRLPIEEQYIASATQQGLFKVPAPEYELIVFIIRMVLKHLTLDAIIGGTTKLNTTEQKELEFLQAHSNHKRMMNLIEELFPFMDAGLIERCMRVLQPGTSTWRRLKSGRELQGVLQTGLRHGLMVDLVIKLWRRFVSAIRWRLVGSSSRRRLEGGGIMIAIVGGDGAGKSTAVKELYQWLSKNFETTKIHMGIPSWSWTTTFIRSILKIGQVLRLYPVESSMLDTLQQRSLVSPGYPWLIREVCRARDRYLTYLKAKRFSAKGAVVIFDRFPVSQIQLMDGPQTQRFINQLEESKNRKRFLAPRKSHRLVQRLIKLEQSYYRQMVAPEILIVLVVNPDIAVQRVTERNTKAENPVEVRMRSEEIWNIDWQDSGAYIISSEQPKNEMLTQLKTYVWSKL